MDYKLSSIKYGAVRVAPKDQRCRRPDRITEMITSFDLEENRIVAAWGWLDLQTVHVPNRLQINIRPTLLLFPISYN